MLGVRAVRTFVFLATVPGVELPPVSGGCMEEGSSGFVSCSYLELSFCNIGLGGIAYEKWWQTYPSQRDTILVDWELREEGAVCSWLCL